MIVRVEWQEHDRVYTIGIQEFLKRLGLDVKNETIVNTIKKLLEQEDMKRGES